MDVFQSSIFQSFRNVSENVQGAFAVRETVSGSSSGGLCEMSLSQMESVITLLWFLLAGWQQASPVPGFSCGLLYLCPHGLQVPRHPGAPTWDCQDKQSVGPQHASGDQLTDQHRCRQLCPTFLTSILPPSLILACGDSVRYKWMLSVLGPFWYTAASLSWELIQYNSRDTLPPALHIWFIHELC